MKYIAKVKQKIQMEFEVEREVEIDVNKKAIVEDGYCEAVEDGDPTGWYEHVWDYVKDNGGTPKFQKGGDSLQWDLALVLSPKDMVTTFLKDSEELSEVRQGELVVVEEELVEIENQKGWTWP